MCDKENFVCVQKGRGIKITCCNHVYIQNQKLPHPCIQSKFLWLTLMQMAMFRHSDLIHKLIISFLSVSHITIGFYVVCEVEFKYYEISPSYDKSFILKAT